MATAKRRETRFTYKVRVMAETDQGGEFTYTTDVRANDHREAKQIARFSVTSYNGARFVRAYVVAILDNDTPAAPVKREAWEADWSRYANMGGAVMDCYRGW